MSRLLCRRTRAKKLFFSPMGIQSLCWSPLQDLEVGPRRVSYLLVRLNCPLEDPSNKKAVRQLWPNNIKPLYDRESLKARVSGQIHDDTHCCCWLVPCGPDSTHRSIAVWFLETHIYLLSTIVGLSLPCATVGNTNFTNIINFCSLWHMGQ